MKLRTFSLHNTMSNSPKTIQIAKKSANSNWWKEDLVTVAPDTKNVQLTISRQKATIVGHLSETVITQLHWAGYTVLSFETDEYGSSGSLTVPLTPTLRWQGIQTILANNGYQVTVKTW